MPRVEAKHVSYYRRWCVFPGIVVLEVVVPGVVVLGLVVTELVHAIEGGREVLFNPGNEGLSLALYLIGKYSIAMVMTSVYVYTAELYPTKYRHSLLGFSSMVGRLGSITAPLTPAFALEVWASFPSVLFGSFALLSGLLIFTTPETLGTTLPDTIEEAERLSNKKPITDP